MSAISEGERIPRLRVGPRVRGAGPFAGMRRRWNEAEPLVAPPREAWPLALRRVRVIGLSLLGVQLLVLCWWGGLLAHHDALSWDFADYAQPMYLIAHGDLNPYSTLFHSPFWQNSFELIIWPLSLVQVAFPSPVTLKVLQAMAMVGAEAVALGWICDIVSVRIQRDGELVRMLAVVCVGLLLLLADPWYTWSLSFDFHPGPFITLLLIAGARDVFRGRRTAWIWLVLTMSCSAIGATYVVALGIAAAAYGRHWLRQSAGIALLGLAWLGMVAALGGQGSTGVYGPLITGSLKPLGHTDYTTMNVAEALIKHPGRAASILWGNRFNFWAELSAAGLIGFFWPPAFVTSLVILAEAGLIPVVGGFSAPGLQNNIPAGPFVTVGTVVLCAALIGNARYRRLAVPAALAALVINTVGWAAVWFPQVPHRWLLVSAPAAASLRDVSAKIRPNDQVIASQGVMGLFAQRRYIDMLVFRNESFPVKARRVWIIIAPREGIEVLSAAAAYADIGQLSWMHGARLVSSRNGVFAFEWTPPPGATSIDLDGAPASIEPWAVGGANARVVRTGNESDWYAESTAKPGYALSNAYYRERRGAYEASVSLSVARSANVEVWDDSTQRLLARTVLGDTHGRTTVRMPIDLRRTSGDTEYGGWGPWRMTPQPPPAGDLLELRVWSPGGAGQVKIYSASFARRK